MSANDMSPRIEPPPLDILFLTRVPQDFRDELVARTAAINDLHKTIARSAIEAGLHLLHIKSRIGHGNFETYIDNYLAVGRRMAQKYMQAASCFGERISQVEYLPLNVVIELARHMDDELTVAVIDAYSKGRKLQDYDVASMARSLERGSDESKIKAVPTPSDIICERIGDDLATALTALNTIASLNLLVHLKRLNGNDLDALCRRLQQRLNRHPPLTAAHQDFLGD